MSVKQKMYGILVILVDFRENFPWFWLIFCYPVPADQNDTDPDPKNWISERHFTLDCLGVGRNELPDVGHELQHQPAPLPLLLTDGEQ